MDDLQPNLQQLHAIIDGRVQGVGFRYFVSQHARSLGLQGWVRNTWDDKVEVTAEGVRPDLETLLGLLQSGPSSSHVSNVVVDWLPYSGKYKNFSVVSTA